MPSHRNFDCWVQCGDQPLEEFAVKVDRNDVVVTCWIPSETGRAFTIHWRNTFPIIDSKGDVYVDGMLMRSCNTGEGIRTCDGARFDSATIMPFIFSPIAVTDDDSALTFIPSDDFGSIKIELRLIVIEGSTPYITRERLHLDAPIHEKEKKVCGHRVLLGEGKQCPTYALRSRPWDPCNPGPYVTFRFLYRSRDYLIAQGIMPMPSYLGCRLRRARSRSEDLANVPNSKKRARIESAVKLDTESTNELIREQTMGIEYEHHEDNFQRQVVIESLSERELEEEILARQEALRRLRQRRVPTNDGPSHDATQFVKEENASVGMNKTILGHIDLTSD
ncbi:hypothetical protein BD410DRAFT_785492 [Rickenella mellea]|uniref:DUF7918 domain-containing protein n=1 Tax=Rickenella mellea TaxID=50990 RepID=A0A4Y7QCG3_9AGAM|nr:hypothetical protein BD410DRAFT_785492 [Rickenella mellea]